MGRKIFLLLAALLLLGGCYAAQPLEDPSPSAAETSTPTAPPTPTPTPTSEPTQEVKELWGFPIDDTHDAFEVPTGGELGTVLVTVERGEENEEYGFPLTLSVWTEDDLTTPIQTMEVEESYYFHWHDVEDANFDGYMDFTYQWLLGAKAGMPHLWLWNEESQQFVEEPAYADIPNPRTDPGTQTISGYISYSAAGDGEETFHHWEDGHLVCFRKEERTYPDAEGKQEMVIYERVNGKLTEVSREPLVMLG